MEGLVERGTRRCDSGVVVVVFLVEEAVLVVLFMVVSLVLLFWRIMFVSALVR